LPKDKTIILSSGDVLKVNGLGVKLEVSSPSQKKGPPPLSSPTRGGRTGGRLVLKAEYDNFSMLFVGNLNDLSLLNESMPSVTFLKPSYYQYVNWDRVLNSVKSKYMIISERWGIPKWLNELADKHNTKIYNLRTDGALTITVREGKISFIPKFDEL